MERLKASYGQGITDEFVIPTVIADDGRPVGPMRRGDQVLAFNFRADRMRQICHALAHPEFDDWERETELVFELVAMTQYDSQIPFRGVAYPPQNVSNHLCEYLGGMGAESGFE